MSVLLQFNQSLSFTVQQLQENTQIEMVGFIDDNDDDDDDGDDDDDDDDDCVDDGSGCSVIGYGYDDVINR